MFSLHFAESFSVIVPPTRGSLELHHLVRHQRRFGCHQSAGNGDFTGGKPALVSSAVIWDSNICLCSLLFSCHMSQSSSLEHKCFLSAGLSALPGGVKFPDSAGAFHYVESGKLLSVTSNRFIHWSVTLSPLQSEVSAQYQHVWF